MVELAYYNYKEKNIKIRRKQIEKKKVERN